MGVRVTAVQGGKSWKASGWKGLPKVLGPK